MRFKCIPDIALADTAFEAYGKDLNELFENAALATFTEMVVLKTVTPKIKKTIALTAEKIESLLYDFLSEIIFLKDTGGMVFATVTCRIAESGVCLPDGACKEQFTLNAEISGERINPKKHKLGNDVKAVTWHMFEVKQERSRWKARVILDI